MINSLDNIIFKVKRGGSTYITYVFEQICSGIGGMLFEQVFVFIFFI